MKTQKNKEKQLQVTFLHDCLLIEEMLVIGDLHIGYDEQSNEESILPGMQLQDIIKKLDEIFLFLEEHNKKIKKIIQLGDLKHDFGKITKTEWRETLILLNYFIKKVGNTNVFILRGNLDTFLKPIVARLNIKLKDIFVTKKKGRQLLFAHGDVINNKRGNYLKNSFKRFDKSNIIFLGHLHPAITLSNRYKKEKYKCFLHGLWNKKEVYILPSFSSFSLGYDLNHKNINYGKNKKEFFVIPYSVLKKFKVIIYNVEEEREYNFGILEKLLL